MIAASAVIGAPIAEGDWLAPHGSSARPGYTGPIAQPHGEWQREFSGPGLSNFPHPVATGDRIIAEAESGFLAMRIADGASLWSVPHVGAVRDSPALLADRIILAGAAPLLTSLSLETGEVLWVVDDGNHTLSTAVGNASTLYVARNPDAVLALSGVKILWSRSLPVPVGAPSLAGRRIVVGAGSSIIALDAAVGSLVWSTPPGRADSSKGAAIVGDSVLSASCGEECTAFAHDLETGAERWRSTFPRSTGESFAANENVAVFQDEHYLHALDTKTGKLRWSTERLEKIPNWPRLSLVDGFAYTGSISGAVYKIDLRDGRVASTIRADGWVLAPPLVLGDDYVLLKLSTLRDWNWTLTYAVKKFPPIVDEEKPLPGLGVAAVFLLVILAARSRR